MEQLTVDRLGLPAGALAGQVAVVTGAGRGIGRESARALARLGASVVIAEISGEGAETERLIRAEGGRALFIPTDVASERSVADLAMRVRESFGPPGILVNNAILCPVAPVLEMPVELWDRVMSVNLRGTFLLCRAFLPEMAARGQGTVVNMVSTDAMPGLAAYIASKQGVAGFTQSLAGEVGPQGVHVVALAPGFVDTPGLRAAGEGLAPRMGMSAEQFMGLSLHPAYPGAMPAADAGAALAYLVVALASECHGEVVTGYWVLERAGVLATPTPASRQAQEAPAAAAPAPAPGGTDLAELARQLQQALADTEAEFGQLPIFVRPLARSGFRRKTGLSLPEWADTIGRLSSADPAQLRERLLGLAEYYRGVPAETSRFTRDAAMLREVTERMARREAVVRALISRLTA